MPPPRPNECSITSYAIKCPDAYAGATFEFIVGGRVCTYGDLYFSNALWPQLHKLKVSILLYKNETIVVSSQLPCQVVFSGVESVPVL